MNSFFPFPTLTTDRLLLRRSNESDLHQILFLRSDAEMNKYIKRTPMKDLREAAAFSSRIDKQMQNGESVEWMITLKEDQKMIGSICLWNFSDDRKQAETGYALHADFQRKGIMTEALQAVLMYGFEDLDLDEIVAYTDRRNEASRKMLVNNGFLHRENEIDEDNLDNYIYSFKKDYNLK